jgi:hypothetical protein
MNKNIKIVFLVLVGTLVLVSTATPPWNVNFDVTPDGEGIKLVWSAPSDYDEGSGCWGKKDSEYLYIITIDGVDIDTVEETEYTLYERCSVIEIAALKDGERSEPLRISVAPADVVTLEVWELNGYGASGIGFGISIYTYMMSEATNRDEIDCYFTDFNQCYQGLYSLASADQIIYDQGYSGSTSGWRKTLISEALDVSDIDDVDIVPAQGYGNAADSVKAGNTYAILTQDGYYGLIQVMEIDETTGEIEIKATFQPIKGLRWM